MSTRPYRPERAKPKEPSVIDIMGFTGVEERLSGSRWNFYRCSVCHAFYVTFDADQGGTPFKISCMDRPLVIDGKPVRRGQCKGVMQSAFYPKPENWPDIAPREAEGEWYAPPRSERIRLKKKNPRLLEYVKSGGLLLRPATMLYKFPEVPHAG